uniref:Homeobox domain-containing protein n=1 Tax=Anopheles christyi TaxID=43041 RepID=A0A182K0V6_9DIPT
MALPTQKPRIGFSIESIVGSQKRLTQTPPLPSHCSPHSESSERPASPLSDGSHFPADAHQFLFRSYPAGCHQPLHHQRAYLLQRQQEQQARELFALRERISRGSIGTPPLEFRTESERERLQDSPHSPGEGASNRSTSMRMIDLSRPTAGPANSLPPTNKGPIMVPGIPAGLVRPFPMAPNSELKSLPTFMGGNSAAEMAVQAAHNQQFLAAQFQAALAHVHGQGGFGGHPTHFHNHPANMPRESYPLYPWLLSRHGRHVFPSRFPGSKYAMGIVSG